MFDAREGAYICKCGGVQSTGQRPPRDEPVDSMTTVHIGKGATQYERESFATGGCVAVFQDFNNFGLKETVLHRKSWKAAAQNPGHEAELL